MIQVTPEKNTNELCIICMDETNSAKTHTCNICVKDAWKICDNCKTKTSLCPVCRTTINTISSDNIVVEIPPFQQQRTQNNVNVPVYRNFLNNNCKELLKLFLRFMKVIAQFVMLIYLGKIYIYTYCAGTCDVDKRYIKNQDSSKVTDRCACYDYVNIDNYWRLNHRFFIEFLLGTIVSGILIGCCIKER